MIEDLRADLNGAPIDASNTDNAYLTELANDDEAITTVAKDINDMKTDHNEELTT